MAYCAYLRATRSRKRAHNDYRVHCAHMTQQTRAHALANVYRRAQRGDKRSFRYKGVRWASWPRTTRKTLMRRRATPRSPRGAALGIADSAKLRLTCVMAYRRIVRLILRLPPQHLNTRDSTAGISTTRACRAPRDNHINRQLISPLMRHTLRWQRGLSPGAYSSRR